MYEEGELQKLYRRLGEWYLMQRTFPKAYSCFNKAGNIERILEHLNNPENIRNELTEFEGSFETFERAPKEVLYFAGQGFCLLWDEMVCSAEPYQAYIKNIIRHIWD